jgi:hypothetical protein
MKGTMRSLQRFDRHRDWHPPRSLTRFRALGVVLPLMGLLILAFMLLPGCRDERTGTKAPTQTRDAEELLENVRTHLRVERPTLASYQNLVHQLNNYLDHKKEVQEGFKLTDAERTFLTEQYLQARRAWQGEAGEKQNQMYLQEVERKNFTLLDAHHLDACFLFRDAARAVRDELGAEPDPGSPDRPAYSLRLARHAFDWVVRQVCLELAVLKKDEDPPGQATRTLPAQDILRRGRGSERTHDRARVFLALIQQLGAGDGRGQPLFEGCMIARTIRKDGAEKWTAWLPGVRIGSEIHVFDTRMGLPVPGPDRSVATLRELVRNPETFPADWLIDEKGESTERFEKLQVLIPGTLSELAPRLRWFEDVLRRDNPVVLTQSPAARLESFRQAVQGLSVEVLPWTSRHGGGLTGEPALILSDHVEWLADKPNRIVRTMAGLRGENLALERARRLDRLETYRWHGGVVPLYRIPRWYHELASLFEPDVFFMDPDSLRWYAVFQRLFRETRLDAGGPRDLLIRGRLEQVIYRILRFENRMDKALEVHHGSTQALTKFRDEASAELKQLELLRGDMPRLLARREGFNQQHAAVMFHMAYDWAAVDLREHLTYFMGLAKIAQAERADAQTRSLRAGYQEALTLVDRVSLWQAPAGPLLSGLATVVPPPEAGRATADQEWEAAALWLERYQALVLGQDRNYWYPAARLQLAICRQRQGRFAEAAEILETLEKSLPDPKHYPPDSEARAHRRFLQLTHLYLLQELRDRRS